jgi:hypothetical protein
LEEFKVGEYGAMYSMQDDGLLHRTGATVLMDCERSSLTHRLRNIQAGIRHCQQHHTLQPGIRMMENPESKKCHENLLTQCVHAPLVQHVFTDGQDDLGYEADALCYTNCKPDFYQPLNVPFMEKVPYSTIEIKFLLDSRYTTDEQQLAAATHFELVHHLTKAGNKVTAKSKSSNWYVCYE